jgi:hypothetical protein
MSIVQMLHATLGGKWTHIPFHGRWECDDGIRYIQRCSVLGGMTGDEHVGSQAWLYGDFPPQRAEKYMYPHLRNFIL